MPTSHLAMQAQAFVKAETKTIAQIQAVLAKRMQYNPTHKSQQHLTRLGFFNSIQSLKYALKNSKAIPSGEISNSALLDSLHQHQRAHAIFNKIIQTDSIKQLTKDEVKYLERHFTQAFGPLINQHKVEAEQAARPVR